MRNQILLILSTFVFLMHPLSLSAQNSFSLLLDVDSATGDQAVTSLNTSPDQVIAIQIFGEDIQNATGVSVRFEYDANQVAYDRFDASAVLPNAQKLTEQGSNFVNISLVSFGGQATVNSGLIGTIRFRTLAAFSGSAIRLVRADLARGGQTQSVSLNLRVELWLQTVLSPDFDGDGQVGFSDFVLFGSQYGSRQGDGKYETKYDLDSDGVIGFSDFVIFGNSYGQDVSSYVAIPDANLRVVIEAELGKARGALITRDEMSTLTRLEAENANIRNLTGLEFATSLTRLDFGLKTVGGRLVNSNSISDLSPLSGLTKLESLNLEANSIADVSALSGLTSLTYLNLYKNSISDISALSGLTSLTWLNLFNNSITDVSALSGLTNLEGLNLINNSIADVSALSGLTNLEYLYLISNSITDVSGLSGLTSLIELFLDANSITDVSGLSGLTSLRKLYLRSNSIADVSALSGLTSLIELFLSDNRILDLAPLVANTGLGSGDRVFVSGNPLSATSINTHIPALQSRGVDVRFSASKPAVEQERDILHGMMESLRGEEWEAGGYIFRR